MTETVWDGAGVEVNTYAGPGVPRRYQITNTLTGEYVTLSVRQAAEVFGAGAAELATRLGVRDELERLAVAPHRFAPSDYRPWICGRCNIRIGEHPPPPPPFLIVQWEGGRRAPVLWGSEPNDTPAASAGVESPPDHPTEGSSERTTD